MFNSDMGIAKYYLPSNALHSKWGRISNFSSTHFYDKYSLLVFSKLANLLDLLAVDYGGIRAEFHERQLILRESVISTDNLEVSNTDFPITPEHFRQNVEFVLTHSKSTGVVTVACVYNSQRLHPRWLIPIENFSYFLPIPYVTPVAMRPVSEMPILADWLEEMRDIDSDSERKVLATTCLDIMRNVIEHFHNQG